MTVPEFPMKITRRRYDQMALAAAEAIKEDVKKAMRVFQKK